MDTKKSNEKVIIFDEYDGEDIDMSWFDELTPEEQEKELLKLKKSMFIKERTGKRIIKIKKVNVYKRRYRQIVGFYF